MVAVVVFGFSVMRCQPLRRALVSINQKSSKAQFQCPEKSALSVQVAQFSFWVFPDANLEESVESLAVSKSLKPRCFNIVGYSTLAAWFHKKLHNRCDLASFVADS
ncbi:hypothetical protein GWZ57_09535 [Vibrio cholerae]|uniref:hypothetical protein n=1 Tax=Vibrio cholerae TaxID=666 RepID=UPI0015608338|nr:hypothetical protein [Vibrio cholerae]NOF70508.1 hypothetical protein [Vibrio cholerae]NOF83112.1 hypothetical protein [Vibrio cholerae]